MRENLWQAGFISPKISANEVHIWRSNLSLDVDMLDNYLQTLSNDEITRVNSFYFKKDKIRYIAARGVLRSILGRYNHIKPKTINFVYGKLGKPYLITNQNIQNLYFNISHSYNYFVCAITKNIDIGVDIERCQNISDLEEIAAHFFSEHEYIDLQNLFNDKKHDYFYKVWTLKEAFVKTLGFGLLYDLRKIRIECLQDNNYKISKNGKISDGKWTLQTFLSYHNYSSAFATKQIISNVLFLDFN